MEQVIRLTRTYIMLFKVTKNRSYLKRARNLGDSMQLILKLKKMLNKECTNKEISLLIDTRLNECIKISQKPRLALKDLPTQLGITPLQLSQCSDQEWSQVLSSLRKVA